VYLQGAIMGMKRAEISRKFDEIVDFAGVSEFIDTPVKRYSSGMNARLGFAVAVHLDPEVLLVDEVLSVGDSAFQHKCISRMRDLIRRGIPIVFISHNLPAILDLCTRAILVDHGTVRFDGDPASVIQQYRLVPWKTSDSPDSVDNGGPIRIERAELLDERGQPSAAFHTTGAMRIRIRYHAKQPLANIAFAVDIHRGDGVYCVGVDTLTDRRNLGVVHGRGEVDLELPQLNLLPGCYLASVGIHNGLAGVILDLHQYGYPFSVLADTGDRGVVYMDRTWTHRPGIAVIEEHAATAVSRKEAAALRGDVRRVQA
jgi:hypothetical protein